MFFKLASESEATPISIIVAFFDDVSGCWHRMSHFFWPYVSSGPEKEVLDSTWNPLAVKLVE